MGRPRISSLHTHYPMRHLIALRPNVCAHCRYITLEKLNFNYASTESLFNAVKKQYGNSHLLKLTLPSPPPSGVPSPTLLPRLPNDSESSGPGTPQPRTQDESFIVKMIETDLESTAKFVRELAVESLIPWMGKCVLEWNEAVSRPFTPSRRHDLTRLGLPVFVISKTSFPTIYFHQTIIRHRVGFELPRAKLGFTSLAWTYGLNKFCGFSSREHDPTCSATETCGVCNHPWRLQTCHSNLGGC
jgi:hypothetical protein